MVTAVVTLPSSREVPDCARLFLVVQAQTPRLEANTDPLPYETSVQGRGKSRGSDLEELYYFRPLEGRRFGLDVVGSGRATSRRDSRRAIGYETAD